MQERNKTRAPLTAEKTLAHFKTITRHRMLSQKAVLPSDCIIRV